MSASEYWASTPHEWNAAAKVWMDARRDDATMQRGIAWLQVALSRTQRLPTLDSVLRGGSRQKYSKEDFRKAREHYESLVKMNEGRERKDGTRILG